MKQHELEEKTYEIRSYIADKFRDIQSNATLLKNVEDEIKVKQILGKISDYSEEVLRGYRQLDELSYETPDEEEQDDTDYDGSAFL